MHQFSLSKTLFRNATSFTIVYSEKNKLTLKVSIELITLVSLNREKIFRDRLLVSLHSKQRLRDSRDFKENPKVVSLHSKQRLRDSRDFDVVIFTWVQERKLVFPKRTTPRL